MKKRVLVGVIGTALAMAPLMVSAAGPTVYGRVNLGIAQVDNGNDDDSSTLGVSDDASRLGVKGDEEINASLKAIYLFEIGLNADDGGWGSGRDVYAGLQGGFGTIRLGQFNSAYKSLSTGLELFGDTIGDFTSYSVASTSALANETRIVNAISYTSPDFSGFKFSLESSRGEQGTDLEVNPTIITASYKGSSFYVGVGSYDADLASTATTGLTDAQKLVASLTLGSFTVLGVAEAQSFEGTLTAANHEVDTTHLGVSYKFGDNTLAATVTDYSSSEEDNSSNQVALGYFLALSKNSILKFVWTKVDNEATSTNAGRVVGANAGINNLAAPAADSDPSGFQAQLSVSF